MPTRVHRLGDQVVNFYVIEDGTDLTVVDTGLPAHYPQLTALLASIGRSVHDIRGVLLTHTHPDHVGMAERLRQEANTTIWAHEQDAPALDNPSHQRTKPEGNLVRYLLRRPTALRLPLHLAKNGAFRTPPVTEVSHFNTEALDLPGRPHVIEVPGHTPGSVAFYLPDRGMVLTGDALVTTDDLTGRTGPTIVNAAFTHDTKQALTSLAALASLDANRLLPGHGNPFEGNIRTAIEQATKAGPA